MPIASADLASFIRSGSLSALQDALLHLSPPEAAEAIASLPLADQVAAFTILPHRAAARVFEYMPAAAQQPLVASMGPKESAAVLNLVADDDRTRFLGKLPPEATKAILDQLTPDESAEATTLLTYPRGTVGRLMTAHYIAVREHQTVGEVLDYVREHGRDSETLNV